MELKFKETNKTFHKIVEFKGEKYLLDMIALVLKLISGVLFRVKSQLNA
ncbi:hypothetical protein SK271_0880 [Streptococcus mitis]|uniref:Uncharacterized protein n=1 Tax=Streptococcus mitis TaxID=28037 RepID=A0A081SAC3_STRMT|nr:hypothetical protein SK271_0880 [Streptococcus mitis]